MPSISPSQETAECKKMGVCVSTCGDAQHKVGVVAASISNQNSMQKSYESPHDPNLSLKKFLHLHASIDPKKSFSSPRTSLGGESLIIPHSSELFSLPDSDAEYSISLSPARTSRASASSRFTASPKSRNSFSVWGGRFSTDRASAGCRKRIRPARSSSALAGDQDLVAHQRLVEAIARLERLNDGKCLQLRGSSFCKSDLERKKPLLPKSRSGELKRPGFPSSRSRHVHHYQLPLQLPKSTMCPKGHDAAKLSDSNPATMIRSEALSQPKTMGSLVSLTGPAIKQMPLEKSVTNFLREVENFVSLIEVPRLSLSSTAVQERKDLRHEPLIVTTVSKSVEKNKCAPRASSYRFEDTDSDEQFTFFEASFEESEIRRKKSPGAKSLQRLVQSAVQGAYVIEAFSVQKSPTVRNAVASPVSESAKSTAEKESLASNLQPDEQSIGQSPRTVWAETIISADSGFEQSNREETADPARPARLDIDTNVMPMTKKSPSLKSLPSRMKALKTFRRGLSRSLDSQESAATRVDFDLLRNSSAPIATSRLSNASECIQTPEATSVEAKNTDSGLLHVSDTSIAVGKLEQAEFETNEEETSTDLETFTYLDTSTDLETFTYLDTTSDLETFTYLDTTSTLDTFTYLDTFIGEPATTELLSAQVLEVPDQIPTTRAESSHRAPGNLDNYPQCPETDVRCLEETLPTERIECTGSAAAAPSLSDSCSSDNTEADLHPVPGIPFEVGEDAQRFLLKAFNSLLKLLQVSDGDQGPASTGGSRPTGG